MRGAPVGRERAAGSNQTGSGSGLNFFAHRWDLGEDLFVEMATSEVTLSGIVRSREHRQFIQEALNGAANFRLNLTLPTASNAPAANDTTIRQDARSNSIGGFAGPAGERTVK